MKKILTLALASAPNGMRVFNPDPTETKLYTLTSAQQTTLRNNLSNCSIPGDAFKKPSENQPYPTSSLGTGHTFVIESYSSSNQRYYVRDVAITGEQNWVTASELFETGLPDTFSSHRGYIVLGFCYLY